MEQVMGLPPCKGMPSAPMAAALSGGGCAGCADSAPGGQRRIFLQRRQLTDGQAQGLLQAKLAAPCEHEGHHPALVTLDLGRNLLCMPPLQDGSPLLEGLFGSLLLAGSLCNVSLAYNRITSLPIAFTQHLASLVRLDVSHNMIEHVADDLFSFTPSLVHLYLEGNRLTALPSSLASLARLQTLCLGSPLGGGNEISALPDATVGALKSLVWLFACHNRLSEIPSCLPALSCLQHVDLSRNAIAGLEGRADFASMKSLAHVDLSHNLIEVLDHRIRWPPSCKVIDLSCNRIRRLFPSHAYEIAADCALLLSGNPCVVGALASKAAATSPEGLPYPPPLEGPAKGTCAKGASQRDASGVLALDLLELAARVQLRKEGRRSPECAASPQAVPACLPPLLQSYLLQKSTRCAACPLLMYTPCSRIATCSSFRGHAMVPMIEDICSPRCLARGARLEGRPSCDLAGQDVGADEKR